MTQEEIRSQFPELSEKVYGKPLVYLDNAATSQRPLSVVEKWSELSLKRNANLHRAVHFMAAEATAEYEQTRNVVCQYINAHSPAEIVFTSGATHGFNLLAYSLGESIKSGDEIIVSEAEHHSNIVPWQMLCKRKGAVLKVFHVDQNGQLSLDELQNLISHKTRLVSVAHISNVLGIVNPIADIAQICHSKGVKLIVDGAQGIVHERVDVQALDCDFYVFSGHKVYAAPGTGVLYGRKELLDEMPPFMGGGEMIGTVSWENTTYAEIPYRFEAGTQNMAGIPTFQPALNLSNLLIDNKLDNTKSYLKNYILEHPEIHLYGNPSDWSLKAPLFSITVDGVHHEDLALILDKMGIAVRSGQMCAEPLMDRYGVTGMLRASFAPYNTLDEAQYFTESLDRAVKMLK